MRFVEVEEARGAPGLRLVIAGGVPSPWSQAAMGLFDIKKLDYVAVRLRGAAAQVKEWTGAHNAPVAIYEQEPPRTGWAEILALAERLGGVPLVPRDGPTRVRMHGLAHEILGERGLCWNIRLLLIHASLTTGGKEGWPLVIAEYLAPKYGYAPELCEGARRDAIDVLRLLGGLLDQAEARKDDYCLGAVLSALDIYVAAGLAPLAPLAPMPPDLCPMLPAVRHAFETLDPAVRAAVPASLLRHRDMMFQRHLTLPVRL
ncbi:MAG: hypothetical protein ABJA82_12805 [Myxococcales bacterium]